MRYHFRCHGVMTSVESYWISCRLDHRCVFSNIVVAFVVVVVIVIIIIIIITVLLIIITIIVVIIIIIIIITIIVVIIIIIIVVVVVIIIIVIIVPFQISWSLDHSPRTRFTEINDLFAQRRCLQQPLHDGDTYDVWIRATDVMNNTMVRSSVGKQDIT